MPNKDPKKRELYRRQVIRGRASRKRIRDWFRSEILSQYKCIQCGEDHPACLDFHHRDPTTKDKEVSRMLSLNHGKERILNEVAKCDVLCANCHRKLHYKIGKCG